MFTLEVMGGLCNRLRAMAAGIKACEENNETMRVIWNVDKGCKARFEELFILDNEKGGRYIESISASTWKEELKIRYACRQPVEKQKMKYHIYTDYRDFIALHPKYWDGCILRTCSNFYGGQIFEWLKPKSNIQCEIDEIVRQYPRNIIGVHIRRTDNEESISKSPITAFEGALNKEIAKDIKVKFYIATDDLAVREYFVTRYGEYILYNKITNKVTRSTREGMKEAVIDLYALSNTKKIFGSYWSSFSDCASDIGRIPLEIIMQEIR